MLSDNMLVMGCHFLAGIEQARAGKELRKAVAVGWRLGIGFGCMGEGIEFLRGIVRRLILRRASCRIVGEWAAW
jgi:hypothetical protein